MSHHESLDDDARDRIAQHVVGTMSPEESRSFRQHLSECTTCRREIEAMSAVASALALAGPRPDLWSRLRERMRAGGARNPPSREPSLVARMLEGNAAVGTGWDVTTIRANEGDWRPIGVPGIDVKLLSVDRENDRATLLARMAPGVSYPAHVHAGTEECFVIEGDLWEGDRRLGPGDYRRAVAGSRHEIQSTREGCTVLVVVSLDDMAA
jgi:putative transcriptional regulator